MNEIERLSELAARILSELEEAGAENFSSTVNTVTDRRGEESEVQDCVAALDELFRLDLVTLRYEREHRIVGEASKDILSTLSSTVSFDQTDRLWKFDENLPFIVVVATVRGRDLAFEILDDRGYQWWRQKADISSGKT